MDVKEKKKVAKIKLVTVIRHPDQENETFELWVEGSLFRKQDHTYLTFEEVQENGSVRTTVRMGEEEALILRGGSIKMRLPFILNEKQPGSYDGGYGSLAVTVHTHTLQFEHNEDRGRFIVDYDLLTGDQLVGEYNLEFTYTEEKQ
ncbi:YwiB family protein [Lederbergia lenta]|uniref:YwiB n=1 Tax=Lederbergia lenta TaxID=1467 RepID=A0A2X4ZRW0_LEDLE|nr:DUF1934 domain-containing protein [Lederbergia lenta]MCM3112092.1 DUF1934 domain-containing protein [Lederbergia lenta]MEC2323262.1 DUF1934 domain-containing protein [Lederbergia lenta]SQI63084.1 YwiB [Lederbergia lenta]